MEAERWRSQTSTGKHIKQKRDLSLALRTKYQKLLLYPVTIHETMCFDLSGLMGEQTFVLVLHEAEEEDCQKARDYFRCIFSFFSCISRVCLSA